jgi:hypothetical protein
MNEAELNRILPATQAQPAQYSSLSLRPRLISHRPHQIPKGSGFYIVV